MEGVENEAVEQVAFADRLLICKLNIERSGLDSICMVIVLYKGVSISRYLETARAPWLWASAFCHASFDCITYSIIHSNTTLYLHFTQGIPWTFECSQPSPSYAFIKPQTTSVASNLLARGTEMYSKRGAGELMYLPLASTAVVVTLWKDFAPDATSTTDKATFLEVLRWITMPRCKEMFRLKLSPKPVKTRSIKRILDGEKLCIKLWRHRARANVLEEFG